LEWTFSSLVGSWEIGGESSIKCLKFVRKELSWPTLLRRRASLRICFLEKEKITL